MCLAFKEILLRRPVWSSDKRGWDTWKGNVCGKKRVVGTARRHFVGSKASEEHGLDPESEGPLGSKWKEGLHCPTSGTEPAHQRLVASMTLAVSKTRIMP